ncbi:MAG: acyl-CoA carboxylase epsilon subunit [Pseudonocardia sp.]
MAAEQTEPTPEERRALFQVLCGEPTDAEVAALTVVLAAVAASAADPSTGTSTRNAWSEPAAQLRTPLAAGAGAWRTSTWRR